MSNGKARAWSCDGSAERTMGPISFVIISWASAPSPHQEMKEEHAEVRLARAAKAAIRPHGLPQALASGPRMEDEALDS